MTRMLKQLNKYPLQSLHVYMRNNVWKPATFAQNEVEPIGTLC